VCLGQLSLLPSAEREMSSSYGTGEGLVWLIWATVCLLAAPWVQLSVSAGNGWPHNVLRHRWLMAISCHFRDCKALLVTSLTHVSGAIASVQTFTFLLSLHAFSSSLFSGPKIFSAFSIPVFVKKFNRKKCSNGKGVWPPGPLTHPG